MCVSNYFTKKIKTFHEISECRHNSQTIYFRKIWQMNKQNDKQNENSIRANAKAPKVEKNALRLMFLQKPKISIILKPFKSTLIKLRKTTCNCYCLYFCVKARWVSHKLHQIKCTKRSLQWIEIKWIWCFGEIFHLYSNRLFWCRLGYISLRNESNARMQRYPV